MRHLLQPIGRATVVAFIFVHAAISPLLAAAPRPPQNPFGIYLPTRLGTISQFHAPWPSAEHNTKPNFILIQNVHCNQSVQQAISDILKLLKTQGAIPARIAVEGAAGPIETRTLQNGRSITARRRMAKSLLVQGDITGAMHFVVAEGKGGLYGIETPSLYDTSVEMFRRSYHARTRLSKDLDVLDNALALLKTDPAFSVSTSILSQDIHVIRKLVDQVLVPEELRPVLNNAIFAVDHLRAVLPAKMSRRLLEPVSASVNFYVLALLRDGAFIEHAIQLRDDDNQATTVIIAGGFHTPGMAQRLKEEGYSYVVITPRVNAHNKSDDRLYLERIMGYDLATDVPTPHDRLVRTHTLEPAMRQQLVRHDVANMASLLRAKLISVQFTIPRVRDIFTAMDQPWIEPPIRIALIKARGRLLAPVTASHYQIIDAPSVVYLKK